MLRLPTKGEVNSRIEGVVAVPTVGMLGWNSLRQKMGESVFQARLKYENLFEGYSAVLYFLLERENVSGRCEIRGGSFGGR